MQNNLAHKRHAANDLQLNWVLARLSWEQHVECLAQQSSLLPAAADSSVAQIWFCWLLQCAMTLVRQQCQLCNSQMFCKLAHRQLGTCQATYKLAHRQLGTCQALYKLIKTPKHLPGILQGATKQLSRCQAFHKLPQNHLACARHSTKCNKEHSAYARHSTSCHKKSMSECCQVQYAQT